MYRRYSPKQNPQNGNGQSQDMRRNAAADRQNAKNETGAAQNAQNSKEFNGHGQMKRPQSEHNVHNQMRRPQSAQNARGPMRRQQSEQGRQPPPRHTAGSNQPAEKNKTERKKFKIPRNPISGLIPSALYNPESKKVLGVFEAEDLLLVALIFILLENDENDDPMLIYALLYILLSDYIDLPF